MTTQTVVSVLQIWRDLPTGSTITNMFAKDLDAGENGTVTFSLVISESNKILLIITIIVYICINIVIYLMSYIGPLTNDVLLLSADFEYDGVGHFEIDSQSGQIRTTELFSQNAEVFYTLRVTAKDGGVVPQEENALVHVQVQIICRTILQVYGMTMTDTYCQLCCITMDISCSFCVITTPGGKNWELCKDGH